MHKKMYLIILLLLIAVISACKGEAVPSPTIDPGQMETQVAEQVAVQLTEIALSQPTATLVPSEVPTIEPPSPTATLPQPTEAVQTSEPASPTSMPPDPTNTPNISTATKQPLPSATVTPLQFACLITKQKPEDGKVFGPGDNFDAVWTVKNTGAAVWDSNEVDYRYDSGDKLHQNAIYDLPETTKPGESIDLVVDMDAPDDEGKYDTTWILRRGSHLICTLEIEIQVEK